MKLGNEAEKIKNLTDEKIREWAGTTIFLRGENYFNEGYVDEIEVYSDGSLKAEVEGSDTYQVRVCFLGEWIVSNCSCPYNYSPCKHAVAAVLQFREDLREGKEIEGMVLDEKNHDSLGSQTKAGRKNPVRSYLESLNKEELIKLIEIIALEYPNVAYKLKQTGRIRCGQLDTALKTVKKKIKKLINEPVYDQWKGDVNIPDYSSLQDELMQILNSGYADEILDLGEEIFQGSKWQLEECDDEGETQFAIESCMEVFFKALGKSSLSTAMQIKKIFDMLNDDEYNVIYNSAFAYFDEDYLPEKMNEIANLLIAEYEDGIAECEEGKETSSYDSELLKEWIVISLDKAGRGSEVIPFLKSGVNSFKDYEYLVDRLIDENKLDEAVLMIFESLKTNKDDTYVFGRTSSHSIRMKLANIYETKGDLHSTASVYADFFFRDPAFESYKKLIEISEKISLEENVRRHVVNYLKSGELPFNKKEWPLPDIGLTDYFKLPSRQAFPELNILIKISLLEKKHEEALNYFDEIKDNCYAYYAYGLEEEIAEAVKETHPERSLMIWKKLVKSLIDKTSRRYYENASVYLLKIRNVLLKQKNESEWKKYINELRMENQKKRAFIEIVKNI